MILNSRPSKYRSRITQGEERLDLRGEGEEFAVGGVRELAAGESLPKVNVGFLENIERFFTVPHSGSDEPEDAIFGLFIEQAETLFVSVNTSVYQPLECHCAFYLTNVRGF